jgi:hypothetical protein
MKLKTLIIVLMVSAVFAGQKPASAPTTSSEGKEYRILSISTSEKMILISDLTSKTRLLLDLSDAKIQIDGKNAEIKDLQVYSSAQVWFEKKNLSHEGITLDGVARRIEVNKKK